MPNPTPTPFPPAKRPCGPPPAVMVFAAGMGHCRGRGMKPKEGGGSIAILPSLEAPRSSWPPPPAPPPGGENDNAGVGFGRGGGEVTLGGGGGRSRPLPPENLLPPL